MRVLVAPDSFGGTLTADQAADAIATGWRTHAPADELDLVPMSDGGPGFVTVLHRALGGELQARVVHDPYGGEVPAAVLLTAGTAYIEAAQACGLHLTPPDRRDPEHGSSRGVGELVAAAADAGARRVVVGLGGTGTNDGGAGLLAALGATAHPATALDRGPSGLEGLEAVDLEAARDRIGDVALVAASDVDNPLVGLIGATNVFGPQKGVHEDRRYAVDQALTRLADLTDPRLATAKGAGAAGGVGFALMLMGAERVPGFDVVCGAVGLVERAATADLVLTGEGSFDFSSRSGKVPYGVAAVAEAAIRPCIALAGSVKVGSREMRALGIEAAYSCVDLVGEEQSFAQPAASLSALAERVARSWSRQPE